MRVLAALRRPMYLSVLASASVLLDPFPVPPASSLFTALDSEAVTVTLVTPQASSAFGVAAMLRGEEVLLLW